MVPPRRLKLKEHCVLEILKFLDINTLRRAQFSSRLINRLIMSSSSSINQFHAQLEMVQLRYSNGLYACKCLPYREKPVEDKFEELNKAVQYIQTLIYKTSIRLLNIHYIDLNENTLELFKQLEAGCISDVSITGCDFTDTSPQKFYEIFIGGNLSAERYTISYAKNVRNDMFDDQFLEALMGRSIKMITLHFCSFTDPNQRFLPMTNEKLMDWLFDSKNQLDYRVFSIGELKLDRKFADKVIEKFQSTSHPKPVTMVVSGEVEQDAEQTINHIEFATGPMPERRVKHNEAPFYLKFGCVQPDRIEFSILKWTEETDERDVKRARRSRANDFPPKA